MDENDIRDFLLENPNYFQQNPELLGLIQIPHASGSAVSLVERQVSVLRERNVDLRHRLRDLGSTAKDNDQLFADTRELVLALLDVETLETIQNSLFAVLQGSFDIEYASLTLFEEQFSAGSACRTLPESEVRKRITPLLGRNGTAGCGALRREDFAFLFPGANIVGSSAAALIVDGATSLGVLCVGSSDAARYDNGTGTLFLAFAAEVLARVLKRVGTHSSAAANSTAPAANETS
ncbi:MAG: DUF484 family protein [Congregibacter sp.]